MFNSRIFFLVPYGTSTCTGTGTVKTDFEKTDEVQKIILWQKIVFTDFFSTPTIYSHQTFTRTQYVTVHINSIVLFGNKTIIKYTCICYRYVWYCTIRTGTITVRYLKKNSLSLPLLWQRIERVQYRYQHKNAPTILVPIPLRTYNYVTLRYVTVLYSTERMKIVH